MRHVQQAGGIVVGPHGLIALIRSQTGRQTFPKGSQEATEQPIDTARREIYEETGLKDVELQAELGTIVRTGFTSNNLTTPSVIKHIRMFYFTTMSTALEPQAQDVLDAFWVKPAEIATMLSWPEEAVFFLKHHAKLGL